MTLHSRTNSAMPMTSAVPLNQMIGQAVEMYEGGGADTILPTERALMTTEGNLATERDGCVNEEYVKRIRQLNGEIRENNRGEEETETERRMRAEAKYRLKLEDSLQINRRYETIFSGLKLNTEHNSAVTQPLGFLVRRLIFAAVIVYMPSAAGVLILLSMSTISLVFTIFETPWKH